MAYRNESERLRLDNDELRRELAEADQTIRRLRGAGAPRQRWPLARRVVGGSAEVDVTRTVPGRLDDEFLGEVIDGLTRRFDTSGQVVRLERRFAWSTPRTFEQTANVDVTLTERDGQVEIRAHARPARLGVAAYALLVGLMLPFGMATAAAISHLPSLVMVLPLFLLSVLAARIAFRAWVSRRERMMLGTVEEIGALCEPKARQRIEAPAKVPAKADRAVDAEMERIAEIELQAELEVEQASALIGKRSTSRT